VPTKTTQEPAAPVRLRRLTRVDYVVPVQGTAPLIVNRWSEKARQMMLDKQQTSAREKKAPKDPVENYEASRYRFPDGRDGFPATAFKAAIVHAGRLFEGVTQVALKQMVLVLGEGQDDRGDALVPIEYDGIRMREDTPRNANGVADLRYRAQYDGWRATFTVRTIKGQFDEESILALVDAAGVGGIGEWRPTSPKSATGSYGTFEVVA
jgi:hypothetical protein